ncbi:MAG: hypothetical protein JSS72_09670 [Armatimonadetes bacterium]|nr:hypothetical protein [Armatimonadota bacterium]
MRKISWILASLVLAAPLSEACLNDRDSLYAETHGHTELLKIIVGWFPVHTDLYYTRRIELAKKELQKSPQKWSLYDDIAVAYDRLGKDVNAIEVIEQKRSRMEAAGLKPKKIAFHQIEGEVSEDQKTAASQDPWYRYYANCGTFWAHRWFHEGMPADKKMAWLDLAQAKIDRAISINEFAHGGREYAQAAVLRWVRMTKKDKTLGEYLEDVESWRLKDFKALAGLIELGGAWESVDVYEAIAEALTRDMFYMTSGQFALLRVQELESAGRKSVAGPGPLSNRRPVPPERVKAAYAKIRFGAEEYRRAYKSYESLHLQSGSHPDIDPRFYEGFVEPPFPTFGKPPNPWNQVWPIAIPTAVLSSPFIALYILLKIRKRKVSAAK